MRRGDQGKGDKDELENMERKGHREVEQSKSR